VTETATAAAASLLFDLQIGGARRLSVRKNGLTYIAGTLVTPNGLSITSSEDGGNQTASFTTDGVRIPSQSVIGFTSASSGFGTLDTILLRDGAANTLALRNGAAAQTFNVYGTYSTSPSLAYSRLAIACDTSGNATLTTQSTGTAGTVSINGVPVGRGKNSLSENIGIGTGALANISTGNSNTAIGVNALVNNTTQGNSVAVGFNAMASGGSQSVGLGVNALQNTSNQCVGIGYAAASVSSTADTIAIGWASLYATTATDVIGIGTNSGRYIADGATVNAVATSSIFIGRSTKALASGQTNQIVIGHDATGLGSNTAVLGNASITTTALRGNVGIGTTAPTGVLDVRGANSITTAVQIGGTALNVGNFITLHGTTTNGGASQIYSNYNTTEGLLILGTYANRANQLALAVNGNVGIGTTAPSSKLHVAETWNNAGTAFTAAKIVVTDTASAAGSDFLELYSGSATQPLKLDINKTGQLNIYGAWTDTSNYERLSISGGASGDSIISTNRTGTGVARGLDVQTDGVSRIYIPASNAFINVNTNILVFNGSQIRFSTNVRFTSASDGILRITSSSEADFVRLQIGGNTDTFPAIARDGAGIKFTGAAAGLTSHIKVPAVAVGSLPSATTAGVGARAFVNDATSPVFGSAVTGGGAVAVPVYSDGSAWNVG
jgi:hypothetical protein